MSLQGLSHHPAALDVAAFILIGVSAMETITNFSTMWLNLPVSRATTCRRPQRWVPVVPGWQAGADPVLVA